MQSKSRFVAYSAICAALYAVGIIATAVIPTPWGIGHFRPAVVIPAFFAFLGGPWVAAIGAALGTFLGDIFGLAPLGLSNPILSLVAGVPANFFAFLLFGYLIRKFNSWRHFVWINLLALFIGNAIAALGVVLSLNIFIAYNAPLNDAIRMTMFIGLTLFWVVTMLPFMLILLPLILKYAEKSVRMAVTFKGESYSVSLSAVIAGIILLSLAFLLAFPLSVYFEKLFNTNFAAALSFISGIVAIILGSIKLSSNAKKL